MKSVSAGVRVAILFLLLAIGGYLVWKNLGQNPAGKNKQELFARFRDASGLPKGSKVVVAGLPQGEVTELEVDGRYAKVTFRLVERHPGVDERGRDQEGDVAARRELPRDRSGRGKSGRRPTARSSTFTPLGARPCPDYDSDDDEKRRACRADAERRRGDHARPAAPPHRADAAERRPRARERARPLRGRAPHRQRPAGHRSRTASTASCRSEADTVAGHHRARRSLDGSRSSRSTNDVRSITQGRRSARSRRSSPNLDAGLGRSEGPRRDREAASSSRPATSCAASSTSSTA